MSRSNLLIEYKKEVIEYLANVGLMSKDTETNRMIYKNLAEMVYIILNEEHDDKFYNQCLHFIDCVANNLLKINIYSAEYKPEPAGEIFKKLYAKLKCLLNLEEV
ncbi:hypothetical protein [Clostridium sp. AWRP]|uniref:hypothetical protein n=1 Tax=Clostridium sp. AWRP TaxID=2212991 RepID=UPI000FDB27FC|nr:hypothetical protein [Clostridium sp. AWRP]AZV58378.1 hypothetical protein DMR38_18285 [Clostridium sp. AWRP]